MRKAVFIILLLFSVQIILLASCSLPDKQEITNTPLASAENTMSTPEKTVSIPENTISIEEDLASRFTTDPKDGYPKELEDAWKNDKSNEQISAMYFYNNALVYEIIEDSDLSKDSMSNISSDYSGVMSDEIIQYGIKLFGSKEIWDSYNNQKEEAKNKITDQMREEIKTWITSRYKYYDELEGKYCGDKYTDQIFQEAADKFGFTTEEIYNIWMGLAI